ncbi:hypothetical protein ACP4OV_000536 [Aristida adscensionis]
MDTNELALAKIVIITSTQVYARARCSLVGIREVWHPNVVGIREVLASRSRVFVVMEYARGGELFAKVARGRLTKDHARRYFQQLATAIGFYNRREDLQDLREGATGGSRSTKKERN